MVANAQNSVLERVITSANGSLSPEAAKVILAWHFTDDDRQQMAALSAKAKAGALTEQESLELDEFIEAGDIISLLHLKARLALNLPISNTASPRQ